MKKAAFAFAAAILGGCGGGTDTISGRVADGYIRGAIVFWDCNGNRSPDSGEVQTTTGAGGAFTITTAPSSSCILAAKVPIGAIDEDASSAPIGRPYTLVSTKGNEGFISPLSTMVAAHMAQNPTATIANSELAVATAFGIAGNLNTDYIAVKSGDAVVRQGVAKIAATVLQNNNLAGQALVSVSQAYTNLQSLAPMIRVADFSNSSTVPAIINPIAKFLAISDTNQFVNTGALSARPVSIASYPESTLQALDNVLLHPYMSAAIRMGVPNYEDISYENLVALKGELQAAGVLLSEDAPIVQQLRQLRNAEARSIDAVEANEVANKNTFFNSDIKANLSFWTTVAISEVDGVTNAIALGTGVPVNFDFRKFNGRPVRAGIEKAFRKYGLWEAVGALATVLQNSGTLLSAENKSAIESGKTSSSDGTSITREQFKALGELIKESSGLILQIIKSGEVASKGKAIFGGAFATIGAISGDCKEAYSAECLNDSLELIESVAEWIHADTHLKAIIGIARAGMDAYLAGVEYAGVTDDVVISDQYKVRAYWAEKTKQSKKYWVLVELAARGVDNVFEAYDPAVACSTGQVRKHGACVSSTQGNFSDDFSGTSLDAKKWVVESIGGNLATLAWKGSYLDINVPGGSCGYCGISDGLRFRPQTDPLVGDFVMELSAEEIARASRDGTPPINNIQLLLFGGTAQAGIYVTGDVNNNQGNPGHTIYAFYSNGGAATYPIVKSLTIGQYYAFKFRIRRAGGVLYLGYMIPQESTWNEVTVPSSFPSATVVTPSIVVASGDGGGTSINSSFKARFHNFTISK